MLFGPILSENSTYHNTDSNEFWFSYFISLCDSHVLITGCSGLAIISNPRYALDERHDIQPTQTMENIQFTNFRGHFKAGAEDLVGNIQ